MKNDLPHLTKLTCTAADFSLLGAELLSKGNSVRFCARGSSMHPMVRDGDALLINPLGDAGARIGEIVLCTAGNGIVLVHRVLRRRRGEDGSAYLVQGDQSPMPDGWIPEAQVHGRLVEIEREGRRLAMTGSAARFLGRLIVLALRMGARQSMFAGLASGLLKRLPVFTGYLK